MVYSISISVLVLAILSLKSIDEWYLFSNVMASTKLQQDTV